MSLKLGADVVKILIFQGIIPTVQSIFCFSQWDQMSLCFHRISVSLTIIAFAGIQRSITVMRFINQKQFTFDLEATLLVLIVNYLNNSDVGGGDSSDSSQSDQKGCLAPASMFQNIE